MTATYEVEPYEDDGEIFAVTHSASGLAPFGSDDYAEGWNHALTLAGGAVMGAGVRVKP